MQLKLVNIVASGVLPWRERMSRDTIVRVLAGALSPLGDVYVRETPNGFPAVVARFLPPTHPKVSVVVFSTGKFIVAGARSLDDVRYAVRRVAQALRPYLASSRVGFQVVNMVFYGYLGSPVDLEGILASPRLRGRVLYDPDRFPGAQFPGIPAVLVFANGQAVVAGARSREEAWEALRRVHRILAEEGLLLV